MWRSSISTYLLLLALVAATGVWLGVGSANAQFGREWTLDGVSHSEFAEWQGRYAGGPVPGYWHRGIPPQAYGCFPPAPCGWAPPVGNPKKRARSRRR